ncbi:MAG: nucleotidyltransferase family protein [Bacteroidetes bacterium]|nr:nucleotidyltransferase family protein [Bacteroidota bacterium]
MNYLLYSVNTTFEEAVRLLDQNGNGFLPVVDHQNKLIGIITDGDLRRGVLNRKFDVDSIINKKPTVALNTESHVTIKKRLRELHRRHMPVINASGELVEVVVLDEFEKLTHNNWVVIMAGGLGTRLGDLTKHVPKPMLEVGGKPMLLRIIEHFRSYGFGKFILCVNYKSEIIEDFFGDGKQLGIEIRYTRENKRMGTAGALSLIDFDIDAPFFVVNGDVLTTVNFNDFLNFHTSQNAEATMCVKRYSYEVPYACVEFDNSMNLKSVKEKPSYQYFINTGMYVLNPESLKYLKKEEYFDMPSLFEMLIDEKKHTKVFTIDEYWLDIGQQDDYKKAQDNLI